MTLFVPLHYCSLLHAHVQKGARTHPLEGVGGNLGAHVHFKDELQSSARLIAQIRSHLSPSLRAQRPPVYGYWHPVVSFSLHQAPRGQLMDIDRLKKHGVVRKGLGGR
jgi:hypothetical protein